MRDGLAPPSAEALKEHVQQALRRYWPRGTGPIDALPIMRRPFPASLGALVLVGVPLPDWAAGIGVEGALLLPLEACDAGAPADWQRVDWWLAAFLMLEAWHERAWEAEHGVIHSYSFRLRGWDPRFWERAWVNRIALFLRQWAARRSGGADADEMSGPVPEAEIELTHDVDAVRKTGSIRLKQAAFGAFNALRLAAAGRPGEAWARLVHAGRFLFDGEDWWMLDTVLAAERRAGLHSAFNFYAGGRGGDLRSRVFDPGYDVADPRIAAFIAAAAGAGWTIGLHPSYESWRSPSLLRAQRERLQSLVGRPVESCRQHWLRFGWQDTWSAQAAAGLKQDTTLMFNDRAGFRAAAALRWAPWNPRAGRAHASSALPTILMDSHFYDYEPMDPAARRAALHRWIGEVRAVGGQAAVLWHPHTLTRDYGWAAGFAELLEELRPIPECATS
jgi:hypothetical protein